MHQNIQMVTQQERPKFHVHGSYPTQVLGKIISYLGSDNLGFNLSSSHFLAFNHRNKDNADYMGLIQESFETVWTFYRPWYAQSVLLHPHFWFLGHILSTTSRFLFCKKFLTCIENACTHGGRDLGLWDKECQGLLGEKLGEKRGTHCFSQSF